ncbi:MAG: DUF1499 domain-containing protein [Pseudomonadota bacterium]
MRTVRDLPERRNSVTATVALRLAVFTPVFALVSIIAHRAGLVDVPAFGNLMIATVALSLLTALLIVIGLMRLWTYGKKGGRRLIFAIVALSIVGLPICNAAYQAFRYPAMIDVSTDLVSPPVFRAELRELGTAAGVIVAGSLSDGYPGLVGRRYNTPADTIEQTVRDTGESLGWRYERTRGRVGANDEITIEFSATSLILALPSTVAVRMLDEGDTTFVDVRSKWRYFDHDLGANARTIERYLDTLDFNLIGVAQP